MSADVVCLNPNCSEQYRAKTNPGDIDPATMFCGQCWKPINTPPPYGDEETTAWTPNESPPP